MNGVNIIVGLPATGMSKLWDLYIIKDGSGNPIEIIPYSDVRAPVGMYVDALGLD